MIGVFSQIQKCVAAISVGLCCQGVAVGQVTVNNFSLADISAGAPTIVVTRLLAPRLLIVARNDTVTDTGGRPVDVSRQYQVWRFEVIDDIKHLYRSALPQRITVVHAYAADNYEMLRESIRGYSMTYGRERYASEAGLTLESVGSDPVVLFLHGGSLPMTDAPADLADAYSLYVTDSLESVARLTEIAELAKQPYRPARVPPLLPRPSDAPLPYYSD